MKKNTLHKVMATALVGAMAMSTLTGCGSSADNTTADAGTKESVAESSAASTDAAKREKSGEPVHFGIRRLDATGIAALCTPAIPGIKLAFYVSICRNNNGSPGSHSRSSRTGVWRSRFL